MLIKTIIIKMICQVDMSTCETVKHTEILDSL